MAQIIAAKAEIIVYFGFKHCPASETVFCPCQPCLETLSGNTSVAAARDVKHALSCIGKNKDTLQPAAVQDIKQSTFALPDNTFSGSDDDS